jgi:CTP:molybdopterin cytidylyltransferase MocA
LLLAAGAGVRFGMPKALWPLAGVAGAPPWGRVQLEAFARAGGREAVVILGPTSEPLRLHLAVPGLRVSPTSTPAPDEGPFASIQQGIATVMSWPEPPDALAVLPVDVPCPGRAVFDALSRALADARILAAVPIHGGRGGHPVLLRWSWAITLRASPPDGMGRLDAQLRALGPAVARVAVDDPTVLLNLNTEEAARAYARTASSGPPPDAPGPVSSRRNS